MYLQAVIHSSYFVLLTSNTIVGCHLTLQAGVPSNMLPSNHVAQKPGTGHIDQFQIGGQLYLGQHCVAINFT